MRILHIAESAKGGVGTYLTEILADQARRFGVDAVRALVPAQHVGHISGVDRRLLATFRRRERSPLGLLTLAQAIRREIASFGPTVVHAHSSVAGVVLRLLSAWQTHPFRVVYCPHGWAFDRRSSALKRHIIEAIECRLTPLADRIVMISEYERDEALRIGIAGDRLSLILNGIADLPPARPARWESERVKVLFVGRLDTQKGFDTLLDAAEPIQDLVSLRVIGKAITAAATVPRPWRAHVDYLGWRSLAEVATEIAAADVVVVPSRWEGFGLVALEAMRGGCAVVASAVGGLREIVVDGETGYLVEPDKPERLMTVLGRHDRAGWRLMGAAGRARFQAMFTADRMNAELAALYEKLAGTTVETPADALKAAHA
jgi:glycosyltransferase involved in cell wall biosynthesis